MSFREALEEYFKMNSKEIVDDLLKGYLMPFNVEKTTLTHSMKNTDTGEEFVLEISLRQKGV